MRRKLIFGGIVVVQLFLFCTAPETNFSGKLLPDDMQPEVKGTSFDSVDLVVPPLPYLSVENWVNQNFLVLQKQKMFCQYGYELYFVNDPESFNITDTADLLQPNNRIPCDQLQGHTLKVKKVFRAGTEYLIQFSDNQSGMSVLGRTYKHALKELVAADNLEWARKRWLNKVVFSRKGVISTMPKDGAGFGSIKVRIQDSLQVLDVVPGYTPLPINPLWLVVQTTQGEKGILPIRSSWTNTMSEKIGKDEPWKSDIFEADPTKLFSFDEAMWETVNNHRVTIGMSRDQVLLSWGEPEERNEIEYNSQNMEYWRYAAQKLYFDKSGLVALENIQ